MLRWLKDKKKNNKKSRPDTPDDYGFKQQRLNPPAHQTGQEDGYDDKTYHIYEEIPDIPTPVPDADCLDESFHDGGFQQDSHHHHHDTHHHHQHSHHHNHHHHHQRPNDGPYMVVPIVGSQTQEASHQQSGLESRSAFSLVEGEGRTAFTCAVIGRRRSSDHDSMAATSSEPYTTTTTTSGCSSDGRGGSFSDGGADCAGGPCSAHAQNPPKLPARPWETKMQSSATSFSSSSGVLSSTSTSSIGTASSSSSSSAGGHFGFGFGSSAVEGGSGVCQIGFLKRPVALPAASAESCQASTRSDRKCCCCGGSGCCSSSSSAHAHSRHDHFRDCDSSCYEYDVSTTTTTATSSSESEQYDNYEVYLAKVEENLMMKHKVQRIILSMEKSRQGKKSSSSSSSSSRNKQQQQQHGRVGVGGRSRMNDVLESDEDFGVEDADCCGKSPKKFHQQQQQQQQQRDNGRFRHGGGQRHHCCGDTAADYDEGTLADQSESENSSGYYESFSPAGDGGCGVGVGVGVGGTVNAMSLHAPHPMTESSSSLLGNSRAVVSCCRESSSCCCEVSPRHREKSSSSSSSFSSCCCSSAPCCRCGHVANTSTSTTSSSSRKTPFCGVRSLELGHRREKSTDSLGKIPSPSAAPLSHSHLHHQHHHQHEDTCSRVNSCTTNACCGGGGCGGSSSRTACGESRRRSCSMERERGPPGGEKRVVGPAGPPLASSHQHQQHKHCHSTLKQLREFAARESAALLAGKDSSSSHLLQGMGPNPEADSYLLPTAGTEMVASTTSSSSSLKAPKEKRKHHDRSHHHHHHHHSKSGHHHRKHRHSSNKPRKSSKGHSSVPDHHGDEANNNDDDDDYEVPGSNPGEGLDTREVEEDGEDSEVYNPPPSVSDFTSRVGGVVGLTASLQPKLSCHKAWKQDSSEIYRTRGSGSTSSSSSSSNRLLSDLIVSNYDRQLFVRV